MDAIHHEVWINAEKSKVFDAITTREGLDAWWGKAVAAQPERGYVVEFDHGLEDLMRMRITDLATNESVAWRCVSDFTDPRNPASEWLGHRLTFDLRTAAGDPALGWLAPRLGWDSAQGEAITILDFRHEGWPRTSRWHPFCNVAWGETLGGLGRYCETGDATGEGQN